MVITASIKATTVVARNDAAPTISITPVVGDTLLVVSIYIDDTSEASFSSITDDSGGANTYLLAKTTIGGNREVRTYYVINPNVAATVITVNGANASFDTIIHASTYQQTATSSLVVSTAENTASEDVTFSATNSDSLLIYMVGQDNNSATWTPYGTGQTQIGNGANGGAEKFASGSSEEIITASGSNDQTSTPAKAGADTAHVIEFAAAVAGGPEFTPLVQNSSLTI